MSVSGRHPIRIIAELAMADNSDHGWIGEL